MGMSNPHDGEHIGWIDDLFEGDYDYDDDDDEFWAG